MNTKIPIKLLSLLAAASLAASASFAQDNAVTSDVVGYVTTTTPNGDDNLFGVTLARSAALKGAAVSVSDTTVTVSSTLTEDAYNNTHYVIVTSGTNAGQWSEITDTSTSTFTSADAVVAQGDSFEIIPFWTLATLFPEGSGVGASLDAFNPSALVLLNNLQGAGTNLSAANAYFYYSGSVQPVGWYRSGDFQASNDVAITPETYITVRNNTGSSVDAVISGTVPSSVIATNVVAVASAAQDNQLTNPYPVGFTLGNSGLTNVVAGTTDAFNPTDTVLVFDPETDSGQNISPKNTYFYYSGTQQAVGWYRSGDFAASDDVVIPAGAALIVRKGAGDNEDIIWTPSLPYTL